MTSCATSDILSVVCSKCWHQFRQYDHHLSVHFKFIRHKITQNYPASALTCAVSHGPAHGRTGPSANRELLKAYNVDMCCFVDLKTYLPIRLI